MKKIMLLLLAFVLAFSSTFFIGCGEKHEHQFEYACDAVNHWKECVSCNEIQKKTTETHVFSGQKCEACTQTQFDSALEFEKKYDGENVTYHVKKYTGSEAVVRIPNAICGKAVTGIANGAFKDCVNLTNVYLPDSLIYAGDYAFEGCTSLNYYEEDGLLYLGNDWNHCIYLAGSTNKGITVATIKKGCTIIGSLAFEDHKKLATVNIPASVVCSTRDAFKGCLTAVLNKVNYLGSIDEWAQITFTDATANPVWYSKKLYINDKLASSVTITTPVIKSFTFFECDSIRSLTLAEGVKHIESSAFEGCMAYTGSNGDYTYYFTELILPSTVEYIGYAAFRYCASINTLQIPTSVKYIGGHAFNGCSRINKIIFEGTKEEWAQRTLVKDWSLRVKTTQVQCSDGFVVLTEGQATDG